jgi:hypothetical protein
LPKNTLFRATSGLNTRIDPARLRYDPQSGVQELAVAYNIDIDDTGRISRRKGYTQRSATAAHSLFAHKDLCFFVSGSMLYMLHSDYSTTALMAVTADARMSYAPVNKQVFFVNGFEKGIFEDGSISAWELPSTFVGPNTTRTFIGPPTGSIVQYYRGRVYVVQANFVFYSEPYDFGRFDPARNFLPFEHDIVLFRAVTDGFWIGTKMGMEFVAGSKPEDFQRNSVTDVPPVQYTDVPFSGRLELTEAGIPMIDLSSADTSLMWLSAAGICYGGASGNFYNLTRAKLAELPAGRTGAGTIIDGRYIGLVDP